LQALEYSHTLVEKSTADTQCYLFCKKKRSNGRLHGEINTIIYGELFKNASEVNV
jgi:hypothetical protein